MEGCVFCASALEDEKMVRILLRLPTGGLSYRTDSSIINSCCVFPLDFAVAFGNVWRDSPQYLSAQEHKQPESGGCRSG